MYSVLFYDETHGFNYNVSGVPDEIGSRLYAEAQQAKLHAELYQFTPGDIYVYKVNLDDYDATNCFYLTKVWFESADNGRFNAVYANGDVIEDGTLELISKCKCAESIPAYGLFIKSFREAINAE